MTPPIKEFLDRLIEKFNRATAQEFEDQSEMLLIIGAYIDKQFKLRFPEEHKAYWEKHRETV